jgi:hypothetical protein
MDLACEIIKNSNVVAGGQQGVSQVRSYKPCSAGNEYVLCHLYLAPIRTWLPFFAIAYLRTAHTANSAKSSARFGGLV